MYLRPAFVETDPLRIAGLIESHPFGVLVTHGADGLDASHIPFVLRGADPLVLDGHLGTPNRQCARIAEGAAAMAVFAGPHAYISPSWYENRGEVPTWDFCAVHVHGRLQAVTEPEAMIDMLDALARHDPAGFTFASAGEYARRLLPGIRAFRMKAERVEAQWKMSQNRSEADRVGVVAALRREGRDDVADLVVQTLGASRHAAGVPRGG